MPNEETMPLNLHSDKLLSIEAIDDCGFAVFVSPDGLFRAMVKDTLTSAFTRAELMRQARDLVALAKQKEQGFVYRILPSTGSKAYKLFGSNWLWDSQPDTLYKPSLDLEAYARLVAACADAEKALEEFKNLHRLFPRKT